MKIVDQMRGVAEETEIGIETVIGIGRETEIGAGTGTEIVTETGIEIGRDPDLSEYYGFDIVYRVKYNVLCVYFICI